MDTTNPKVDAFLNRAKKWKEEMEQLRSILLDCQLTEELKWGKPCYTFQKRNTVIIIPLKESCALMFFQGALLDDADGILVKPGENTRMGRWVKFTSVPQIVDKETILKAYIHEAIEVGKSGLKMDVETKAELTIPEELQNRFDVIPALNTAFVALTPGRQRAYALYFSAPKQSKTRASRVEKCMQQILDGKGLNDR